MAMMAQALGRTKRVQRGSKGVKESQREPKGVKGCSKGVKGSQRERKRQRERGLKSKGVKGSSKGVPKEFQRSSKGVKERQRE